MKTFLTLIALLGTLSAQAFDGNPHEPENIATALKKAINNNTSTSSYVCENLNENLEVTSVTMINAHITVSSMLSESTVDSLDKSLKLDHILTKEGVISIGSDKKSISFSKTGKSLGQEVGVFLVQTTITYDEQTNKINIKNINSLINGTRIKAERICRANLNI